MLSSLAPARRLLVLAVLAALAVVLLVVGVRLTGGGEPAVRPVAQDQPGPVLLVPGYGGSTTAVDVLAAALQKAGREAVVVDLPGRGTGDLRTQAQALAAAAEAAMRQAEATSVDVIGYSAGGVVARLWVREEGGDGVARRVVTLGSPHHGTAVAELARDVTPDSCPPACQQLVPDSDLLRSLNAGDETPPGPAFVTIWTTLDRIVTPPESARLDGALEIAVQSVCPQARLEHGQLPLDVRVQAMVLAVIDVAAPTAPQRCTGRG